MKKSMHKNDMNLSVIVPFYNEEDNLGKLHKEIIAILIKLGLKTEIIYIDDGSTDSSQKSLKVTVEANKAKSISIRLITLKKNSGQTAATAAGIDHAKGKILAFLDADLQNDPNDLILLLKKLREGFDAVCGWRKKRSDTFLRKFFSSVANLLIRKLFKVPLHDMGCSLKVVKREALVDFKLYSEYHRLLPALIYWNGYKVTEVEINHRARNRGKSKYGYMRIFKLIIDLTTIKFLSSYQTKPSYVFGTLGIVSNILGIITLFAVAYRKFFEGSFVHNDPLFLIAIFLILAGLQFILMGLLAELVVRIYFETQKKLIYEKAKVIEI